MTAQWAQTLLNLVRPEFQLSFYTDVGELHPLSIAKQLQEQHLSRFENLKRRESKRGDVLCLMPGSSKKLSDWIYELSGCLRRQAITRGIYIYIYIYTYTHIYTTIYVCAYMFYNSIYI